jgi:hypothetical protein
MLESIRGSWSLNFETFHYGSHQADCHAYETLFERCAIVTVRWSYGLGTNSRWLSARHGRIVYCPLNVLHLQDGSSSKTRSGGCDSRLPESCQLGRAVEKITAMPDTIRNLPYGLSASKNER